MKSVLESSCSLRITCPPGRIFVCQHRQSSDCGFKTSNLHLSYSERHEYCFPPPPTMICYFKLHTLFDLGFIKAIGVSHCQLRRCQQYPHSSSSNRQSYRFPKPWRPCMNRAAEALCAWQELLRFWYYLKARKFSSVATPPSFDHQLPITIPVTHSDVENLAAPTRTINRSKVYVTADHPFAIFKKKCF
jgi:hypothetical protein